MFRFYKPSATNYAGNHSFKTTTTKTAISPHFFLFFLPLNSNCHQKKRSHFSPHGSKERLVRSCSVQQYITDTVRTAHSLGNNSAERFLPTCIIVYTHVNAPPTPLLYCLHAGACGLLKPQSLSDQERLACMCLTSIKRPLPFSRCTWAACNDPLF